MLQLPIYIYMYILSIIFIANCSLFGISYINHKPLL